MCFRKLNRAMEIQQAWFLQISHAASKAASRSSNKNKQQGAWLAQAWSSQLSGHSVAFAKLLPRCVVRIVGSSDTLSLQVLSIDWWSYLCVCVCACTCAHVWSAMWFWFLVLRFLPRDDERDSNWLIATACNSADVLWRTLASESSFWLSDQTRRRAHKVFLWCWLSLHCVFLLTRFVNIAAVRCDVIHHVRLGCFSCRLCKHCTIEKFAECARWCLRCDPWSILWIWRLLCWFFWFGQMLLNMLSSAELKLWACCKFIIWGICRIGRISKLT